MNGLLCYCRQGFEPDLAAELSERAANAGFHGYAKTERNSGYVTYVCEDAAALSRSVRYHDIVFARQKLELFAELKDLNPTDRVTPMLEFIAGRGRFGDVLVEHPDSDEGKPLSGLARAFTNAMRPALRKRGLLSDKEDVRLPRLHIFFLTGTHALLASSDPKDSSPFPLGVPRLRAQANAPSRSALKLDEALMIFMSDEERAKILKPGMHAADLGAAPGGWSWILTKHGLHVSSIDNGPMSETAMATGLINHIRADGFNWQPPRKIDWMVCDMVESPRKVAHRMSEWFANGWCKHAIFNLKLPMKKRWEETRLCLDEFEQKSGKALHMHAKQLYHDREEITVFATVI
ncbi:MAG: 23S rRNA (cytidine(2498)-2'-O)-methyltransferase RlmM [Arenimonas sp.]